MQVEVVTNEDVFFHNALFSSFNPQWVHQFNLSHQVAIALVVVFGVFQIPCSGSLPLFILLSLLQGEFAKCTLLYSTISKQYWKLMDGLLFDELHTYVGLVGMSYGFFLSTVCSTTADAMKLAIRFQICDHDNSSSYNALIKSWAPQPKIKHIITHCSSFFPTIMLCGFVWPLEGMPYPWLRSAFVIT